MPTVPHLVQYQGSKRILAPEILRYFPTDVDRLIEPFCGTCAVTILAAKQCAAKRYIINDINEPLVGMMRECIENPTGLYETYSDIWRKQFSNDYDHLDYFYKLRREFNDGDKSPAMMLFLLARVVKGAVRYGSNGEMNQSCDKRRYGTKPETVLKNATAISYLLKGKTEYYSTDYKDILKMATPEDLVYMDPPYQGTSNAVNPRDNRYIQGVQFDDFVEALEDLNKRNIRYIVSYDGKTGDKVIGKNLPEELDLTHLLVNAGTSAQATLNGKPETTFESLYFSRGLIRKEDTIEQCHQYEIEEVTA